ncbi:hypothetical protein CBL_05900 [Carabus blaptoides fortunei]
MQCRVSGFGDHSLMAEERDWQSATEAMQRETMQKNAREKGTKRLEERAGYNRENNFEITRFRSNGFTLRRGTATRVEIIISPLMHFLLCFTACDVTKSGGNKEMARPNEENLISHPNEE